MKTIDPGAEAKDCSCELTRSGTWRINCQCPQCNHRNQHNGGRGDQPAVGTFECAECSYHYIVPEPKKEIQEP